MKLFLPTGRRCNFKVARDSSNPPSKHDVKLCGEPTIAYWLTKPDVIPFDEHHQLVKRCEEHTPNTRHWMSSRGEWWSEISEQELIVLEVMES